VTESALIVNLSEHERKRLAPYLKDSEMKFNATLIEQGGPILRVWFPHNAVTSTLIDTAEGTTIEVGLMGFEGMVGLSLLLGKAISNTTVIVQVGGMGTTMEAEEFNLHVREHRGELYDALLLYTDAFLAMVAQTAACNSLHSVDARLSRWILMTHDRVKGDDMPLTQEFLGYMLGVRRASISMAANNLQKIGLIKYSRGHLTVVDRAGLERNACACYFIVKNISDGLLTKKPAA